MNPIAGLFRSHLRRRLFLSFGAGIIITFATFSGVHRLFEQTPPWKRELGRLSAFAASRYEKAWEQPGAREELTDALVRDLQVFVEVDAADGSRVYQRGECPDHAWAIPIMRGTTRLGDVRVCPDPQRFNRGGLLILPFGIAALLLWLLSGRLARRLALPVDEISRVAQEIGAGNLKARADLACHSQGAEGVLAHAINDMAAKIERQLADQRELLAAVSHEMRTPLARIRMLTELAREQPEVPKHLDGIDREVVEVDSLVGDLLASARLDFQALAARDVDVAGLAREVLERAEIPAAVLQAPEHLVVRADPTLVARAISNLVVNAQTHGQGLRELVVTPTDEGGVRVEARDAGPGFAAEELPTAFEAFQHKGKNGGGSLGLGLALVKRIAAAHGGGAELGNLPGGGARVSFQVPREPPSSPRPVTAGT